MRNDGLPLLIVDIHHRGQRYPTLALRAKRHQDAESLCEDRLRTDLSTLTFNGIPLCNARATMKVRLGEPRRSALYQQAMQSIEPSSAINLVYLVDLDG